MDSDQSAEESWESEDGQPAEEVWEPEDGQSAEEGWEPEDDHPAEKDWETDCGEPDDIWENDGDDEDWGDEPQAMKPAVMALVIAGLVILAAIICGILWYVTHGKESEPSEPSAATEEPVQAADSTAEPEAEATATPVPEETAAPETTENPAVTAAPTPEVTAAPQPTEAPAVTAAPTPAVAAAGENASAQDPVSGSVTMAFTDVQETVTAKDVINLRTSPSTSEAENIAAQAKNGESLTRTGINQDTGWSRIDYNGQTLYAVSQYLTTDLTYTTPVQAADPNRVSTKDGRVIVFTDCDDTISPKEYVNLRLEPSTSEGNATVHCKLEYGETAHRTGYSTDSGWSRVEYDGKVLYVVTSMIYVVTETE